MFFNIIKQNLKNNLHKNIFFNTQSNIQDFNFKNFNFMRLFSVNEKDYISTHKELLLVQNNMNSLKRDLGYKVEFFSLLSSIFPGLVFYVTKRNLFFVIAPVNKVFNVIYILAVSSFFLFEVLGDIHAAVSLNNFSGIDIDYYLTSMVYNWQIFVSIFLFSTFIVQSLSKIFESTLWMEREVWDMFGVFFLNHPDLRRILTDYGFKGHPLRKEFPVVGFVELAYSYFHNFIVYDELNLQQQARVFSFANSNYINNNDGSTFE